MSVRGVILVAWVVLLSTCQGWPASYGHNPGYSNPRGSSSSGSSYGNRNPGSYSGSSYSGPSYSNNNRGSSYSEGYYRRNPQPRPNNNHQYGTSYEGAMASQYGNLPKERDTDYGEYKSYKYGYDCKQGVQKYPREHSPNGDTQRSVKTVEGCEQKCLNKYGCVGWDFNFNNKMCYLHDKKTFSYVAYNKDTIQYRILYTCKSTTTARPLIYYDDNYGNNDNQYPDDGYDYKPQSPDSNYNPDSNYQPPDSNYQPQPPDYNYQPPDNNYQPPNTNYQPTDNNYPAPDNNYQPPNNNEPPQEVKKCYNPGETLIPPNKDLTCDSICPDVYYCPTKCHTGYACVYSEYKLIYHCCPVHPG